MKNLFMKEFDELKITTSFNYNKVKTNWIEKNIIENSIEEIQSYIFSNFYRYNEFEYQPMVEPNHNLYFHETGLDSPWKKSQNDQEIKQANSVLPLNDFCINPRLKRDVVLAWSIRKDFYKYHIKFEALIWNSFKDKIIFLEEILPQEENLFFLFEDGLYICNLINNENLKKIEDFFGKENVIINDHELYFEIDNKRHKQTFCITIEDELLPKEEILKFNYFWCHIPLGFFLKGHNMWLKTHTNIFTTFQDENFLKAYDPRPEAEFIIQPWNKVYIPITQVAYENFIEAEWKRIPEWYKPYMKPEMLDIKRTVINKWSKW